MPRCCLAPQSMAGTQSRGKTTASCRHPRFGRGPSALLPPPAHSESLEFVCVCVGVFCACIICCPEAIKDHKRPRRLQKVTTLEMHHVTPRARAPRILPTCSAIVTSSADMARGTSLFILFFFFALSSAFRFFVLPTVSRRIGIFGLCRGR